MHALIGKCICLPRHIHTADWIYELAFIEETEANTLRIHTQTHTRPLIARYLFYVLRLMVINLHFTFCARFEQRAYGGWCRFFPSAGLVLPLFQRVTDGEAQWLMVPSFPRSLSTAPWRVTLLCRDGRRRLARFAAFAAAMDFCFVLQAISVWKIKHTHTRAVTRARNPASACARFAPFAVFC